MTVLVVAESLALVLLATLVVSLLRSHAEILRALHDLGISLDPSSSGGPAVFDVRRPQGADTAVAGPTDPKPGPLGEAFDLMGRTPDGEVVALAVASAEEPTLLAFLSSGCRTCHEFWDVLGRGETVDLRGRDVHVVAVTRGFGDESPAEVAGLTTRSLTTLMTTEAFEDYGVPVAPYFVLVDAGRVVGEGAASSWVQLRGLLSKAVADGAHGRTRRDLLSGRLRNARVDRELSAAGIGPDHASLRPEAQDHGPASP